MQDQVRTSDVLGSAGACPEIHWNGKTWRVGHATLRARDCLAGLTAAKADENVEKLRDTLPPASFARRVAALDAALQANAFATWGSGWQAVTGGPDGEVLFLLALLRENHPEATEADAVGMMRDRPRQVKLALLQVMPGFFALLVDHPKIPPDRRPDLIKEMNAQVLRQMGELTPSPTSPSS